MTALNPPFLKGARGIQTMYYLPYNKQLKSLSRALRKNSTLSEVLLWQELRAGQMEGFKFNRQKPLGKYIVDFYCKKLNLVIEIDGDSHDSEIAQVKDAERQSILEDMGLSFIRFDDLDVKKNRAFVLNEIYHFIEDWNRRHPNPPAPPLKGDSI